VTPGNRYRPGDEAKYIRLQSTLRALAEFVPKPGYFSFGNRWAFSEGAAVDDERPFRLTLAFRE
jgi:hypothetical protein